MRTFVCLLDIVEVYVVIESQGNLGKKRDPGYEVGLKVSGLTPCVCHRIVF